MYGLDYRYCYPEKSITTRLKIAEAKELLDQTEEPCPIFVCIKILEQADHEWILMYTK